MDLIIHPTQVRRTFALAAAVFSLASFSGESLAQTIDHTAGFAAPLDYQLNGNAVIAGTSVTLTDTTTSGEAGSLFSLGKVNVSQFSTNFQFQLMPSSSGSFGDGITFTIQNNTPQALGGNGSNLGYGGITSSFTVKLDTYLSTSGTASDPSADSMGFFSGGVSPIGGNDMSCCVNLRSNHFMNALIEYDGSQLTVTISDLTANTFYEWYWTNINIPQLIGGSRLAYVGFTGGTGGSIGTQEINNWIWRSIPPMVAVDLKALPNPCLANYFMEGNAINDLGQVVGQGNACFDPNTYTQHAFIWDPVNLIKDLYTADIYQSQYYGVSSANSINVHGTVVGDSYITVIADRIPPATLGVPQYLQAGFSWTAAAGTMTAVQGPATHVGCGAWQPQGLPCSSGWSSYLRTLGVNDGGEIVGWMADYAVAGYPHGMYSMTIAIDATPAWFVTPQVSSLSRANAINVNGLAVGDTGDGQSCALFDTTNNTQKSVSAGTSSSQSLSAVNSSGYAVGSRDNTAILWVPSTANGMSGSFVDMISSSLGAKANGINDAGLVIETVGSYAYARLPSTSGQRNGIQVSLDQMNDNGLITLPSGPTLSSIHVALYEGRAVNNLGQMVATGSDGHAYLLTPAINPVMTTMSPATVALGSAAFTLTINGSKFMYGSQVYWNGNARPTTVVSPTQLTASISASDVSRLSLDTVSVSNPTPNSTNASLLFRVR
jgi:Bacterial lectin